MPGTPEWKRFTSTVETIEACRIPDDILRSLSTKDLWDVCLKYPLLSQYTASNSPYKGIQAIISVFNGLTELMNREDANKVIYSHYLNENVADIDEVKDKGAYTFDYCAVELILAQKQIISRFTREEQLVVMSTMLQKYSEKQKYSEYFGLFGKISTVFAANKYAESTGKRHDTQREQTKLFTEEMLLTDGVDVDILLNELFEYQKSTK